MIQRAFITGALSVFVAACAVEPKQRDLHLPAVTLSVVGAASVIDMRAHFRPVFCQVLLNFDSAEGQTRCDEHLWHLPDEKPAAAAPLASYAVDPRLRVLIVGGAFGDCYPPSSTPFVESVRRLKAQGLSIGYADVSGRSTAELNAKLIAERIAAMSDGADPVVLVGYSKGVADILDTLALYPEAAARVSAVVSIAGAVNGSPLAGQFVGIYNHLFSSLAIGACPPGNGGVLESLTRSTRLNWLADNSIPSHIRYYSIATFTTPRNLARILAYPQRRLSTIDARNDGQLLTQDQLIPGSEFLGYANADHWAIAVRMEDRFPFLAHRPSGRHPFPQQAFFESILLFVQRDLQDPTGQHWTLRPAN